MNTEEQSLGYFTRNTNNNVEAAAAVQVQMLEIDSKIEDSLQLLPECLKSTSLYEHHKIIHIPSDSIKNMYQNVGPKEGTTQHKSIAIFWSTFCISLWITQTGCIVFKRHCTLVNIFLMS